MFQFIQQQTELVDVLQKMDQCSIYGLDTEFIKVDTLWPKLGVCQVNVNGDVYLLDGVSLDLSQFWKKIFLAQQNIFHACGEDIDLIYHYADQEDLLNVFDTQVGLSFLGHGLQVSYQSALKLCLDIDIEKDQTRSDWLARPLSPQQLCYAANDVLYLMKLAHHIQEQLKQKGLYNYVLEDCSSLTKEIISETPNELLYTDVGNYRHSRRQLMQLQNLSEWREYIVKATNQPRSFILRNSTMIDMVEKNPRNSFQLSQVKDIRPNVVREYGKTILELLKDLPVESKWPSKIAKPFKVTSKETLNKMDMVLAHAINETSISKEVLLRKKWLNAIHQHVLSQGDEQDLPDYLLGWRYELLTQPLIQLFQEEKQSLSI
ncbi:ribonuclease D [Acinetobacter pittii]|uniref:ribonuclease D n=1 Tax=Acinetobacter pittii TaxID=48296 RepID=UPI000A3A42AD|nr:HRDC domain-containing protein [Acinetobacter pittii]MCZ1177487.1 HRDC domain-containing protein [Acinetobacter pittii]OTU23303.1 ribonuclease D [Acinetobacter pittii]QDB81776.1 ribonuclease D [Acinetobacter pittii]QRF08337.1 HRDC domain-containing protein [Acinetobacter pittii]